MKKIKRRLAAIMFTDMVGYSAMMQKDEELARRLRDRHREVFVGNTERYGGEVLQYYGDGTLSIYPSASAAVECALDIQRALREDPPVSLRIGIHTGDINYSDEDVYGDGVNIAARIEALCVPGGIFISGKVYDDIKNHPEIKARHMGPFKLKNIYNEVEIYAVTNKGVTAPPPGKYHKISPFERKPLQPLQRPAESAPPVAYGKTAAPVRGSKNKFAAGMLALFFGIFGAHRFYLGQRKLGIAYLAVTLSAMFVFTSWSQLIPVVAIIAFVDSMLFFFMSRRDFDHKYNAVPAEATVQEPEQSKRRKHRRQAPPVPQKSADDQQFDDLCKKALSAYREYDYGEAIFLLNQAAGIKPHDAEVHFMLARCYSVNENVDASLTHLDAAVANGLTNMGRIKSHQDLAYLRMQPQFEAFEKNDYRLLRELPEPVEDLLGSEETVDPDLLEKLQQLRKMREEGSLTEIEYRQMVKKLND